VIILIYVVARIVVALKKGKVTRQCGSAMSAAAPCQKSILELSLPRTKTAAGKLPPPDTKRWTAWRKAAVVEALNTGMFTIEQVCHPIPCPP
jgi:Protein of unknown function (DUF1153)